MTLRNITRDNATKHNRQDDWELYCKLRNKCSKFISRDRKVHFEDLNNMHMKNNDARGLFSLAKKRMGWKEVGAPKCLARNGKMSKSPREMANWQLEHFQNKIKMLMENLPNQNENPTKILSDAMERWRNKNSRPKFKLSQVDLCTTVKIIKSMKNGTSYGHDNIDPLSIKLAATNLYKPINFITNLSISTGKFANRWKLAKVLPLYKGKNKDKNDPDSYRPICLLPVISKIVEKSVQIQTMEFMNSTEQWNGNNHAYKAGYSTTTTLLQMSDKIIEACDRNEISVAMGIDESSAFDCVDHEILCKKMEMYNFEDETIKWIKSYLASRAQYVSIGAHCSKMLPVNIGVPQGSVLGPLIFTLYINELPDIVNNYQNCGEQVHKEKDKLFNKNCILCGNIPCYADDTTVITSSNSRFTNQNEIIEKFDKIKRFLNSNKLSVNAKKTVLIEVMMKQKRIKQNGTTPELIVRTDKNEVKVIKSCKSTILLGGTIQQNSTWQAHLETGEEPVIPKLRKLLGNLKFIGREIPEKGKLILVNGILISRMIYLMPMWGGTSSKYIKQMQAILNNCARYISGKHKRTKTLELMEYCKWLTVAEMIDLYTLVAIYRIVNMNTPEYFTSKMNMDQDNLIFTSKPRIQNTEQSFRWRGITLWNTMPPNLREIKKISQFKTQVKCWIKDKRTPNPD